MFVMVLSVAEQSVRRPLQGVARTNSKVNLPALQPISTSENDIVRKEMGLGWMLKSKKPAVLETNEIVLEEVQVEEVVLV